MAKIRKFHPGLKITITSLFLAQGMEIKTN